MARVRTYLDTLPELVDIDDSAALPSIEWRIEVDRTQAAIYGADVSSAGLAVQLVTNGVKVAEYRPDNADEAVDIRVRYPRSERGMKALDELRISTSEGMVPLRNFVSIEPAPGVDALKRIPDIIESLRELGYPARKARAELTIAAMSCASCQVSGPSRRPSHIIETRSICAPSVRSLI